MDETEQDRSEQPTPFKLKRSREKGVVARGMDLGFMGGLLAFLGFVWIVGAQLALAVADAGRKALVGGFSLADDRAALVSTWSQLFTPVLQQLAFMALLIFVAVLLFEILQTGLVFSSQPLKPDFNRLNPAGNFKRLFSLRMLLETAKNIAKFSVYCAIGYILIMQVLNSDIATVSDGRSLLALFAHIAIRLLGACVLAAMLFAVVDQLIVRHDFLKRMRMSRRELRRELREREGEPRLKQKRKQLHAEFARLAKSMRNLRKADVLITNPVHYAVALQYNARTMWAPHVVSAGANRIAQRLKHLAFVYSIPIVENRALARELYLRCSIDHPIPERLFQPVADVYNTIRRKIGTGSAEERDV